MKCFKCNTNEDMIRLSDSLAYWCKKCGRYTTDLELKMKDVPKTQPEEIINGYFEYNNQNWEKL